MRMILGVLLTLAVAAPAYSIDIATVRQVDADCYPIYYGSQVTIEGLVVCGNELGSAGPAYIEDATAGVAYYFYPIGLTTGDYVTVTAWVDFYNGLIELADDPATGDPTTVVIHSSGNPVTPHVITIPEMNDANEGKLVTIECVFFHDAGEEFSYTHTFEDAFGNVGTMYTDTATDIDGTIIPTGFVNLTGCLGQYDNSSPYCDGYQVIPRSLADIVFSPSAAENMTWSGVKALYR